MKVKELIIELQKCNPEAIVIYNNMNFFEVDDLIGKDSDDLKTDFYRAPIIPLAQAKSIIIY